MSKLNILGNLFITSGFAGLIFTFWPLFAVYFDKPVKATAVPVNGAYISIPKINAEAPIIFGVDPFNKTTYLKALEHGVAQAAGTSLPGKPGTMYIFAHSSDLPWHLTRTEATLLK